MMRVSSFRIVIEKAGTNYFSILAGPSGVCCYRSDLGGDGGANA